MKKNELKKIKNETKEHKAGFLGMLLGTLGATLLWDPLTGKETISASEELSKRHATKFKEQI